MAVVDLWLEVGGDWWEMNGERWDVTNGRWAVGGDCWAMVDGERWAVRGYWREMSGGR